MVIYANSNLREIAKKRVKTVSSLIEIKDFECAAYIMGLTGEIALKAVISKRLRLSEYPPSTTTDNQQKYLKTHNHQELIVLSGLNEVFAATSGTPEAQNWSDYTTHYKGDWIGRLRYNELPMSGSIKLTDDEVLHLYDVLIKDTNSIINYIKKKNLW